jgi:hypothetical protein
MDSVSTIELIGLSVTVALSPFPILVIVPLLTGERARMRGGLLAFGWAVGLLIALGVSSLILNVVADGVGTDAAGSTWIDWVKAAVGIVLVAVSMKTVRARPRTGEEPTEPGLITSLAGASNLKVLAIGIALAALNPKIILLAIGAASAIADGGISIAIGGATFVLIGSLSTLALLLVRLADTAKSGRVLAWASRAMARHGGVVIAGLLTVIGIGLIAEFLATLG